jgi:hypothetical protein
MVLWAAEQQEPAQVTPESTSLLQLETARDHLRSMALDWPQRQSQSLHPTQLTWLSGCPFPLATPPRVLTPDEVDAQRQKMQAWLESATPCTPLQCLAQWQPTAETLQPNTRTLDVLDADPDQQAANLRAIATSLAAGPDFALRPQWQGACAETGVWSRLRQRQDAPVITSAWTRLQARWIELLELISVPTEPPSTLLSSGALPLGYGQAIAWCEMARGLLLHWVQLDEQHCVQDYRVLAPTEWNFHPDGALAQALTQLKPDDAPAAWCLASAYDPCVDCNVNIQEISHA